MPRASQNKPPKQIDIETPELAIKTFQRLKMGYGITKDWDQAPLAAFRINPDSPPLFSKVNQNLKQNFVCEKSSTKKFVESHMAVAAAKVCAAHLLSSGVYAETFKSTKKDAHKSVKYHLETLTLHRSLTSLRLENLIVEDGFKIAIENALKHPGNFTKETKLNQVWEDYGYFFSRNIVIGGKITSSNQSSNGKETEVQASGYDIGADVKAKVDVVNGVGVAASFRVTGDKDLTAGADKKITASTRHVAGGSTNLTGKDWENSVDADPSSWEIVERDRVIPIWQMLDGDLAEKVKAVITASFKSTTYLTFDKPYIIKNLKTEDFLKGVQHYVFTAHPRSGGNNEENKWKFIPVCPKDSTSDSTGKSCLRYGDKLYIQPAASDNSYLHASYNKKSIITNKEGYLSVRQFVDPDMLQPNDIWIIERANAPDDDDETGIHNIDLKMRIDFVQATDEFHLRCAHKGYLASHKHTFGEAKKSPNLKSIRSKRRNPFDLIKGNDEDRWLNALCEVIMLPEAELDKDYDIPTWRVQ